MIHRYDFIEQELKDLQEKGNARRLPEVLHEGRYVVAEGRRMLNISSNDYLGLANDEVLRETFARQLKPEEWLMSASSSRLLTGNHAAYKELEGLLAELYGAESALVFGCGYHANTGILPALADARSLILADKLVHASLIDGIRLSPAKCIRYRHNDLAQLTRLVEEYHAQYERIFVVTESIFSMDGDEADLKALAALKARYDNLFLYIDEAHAFGVRGPKGLGCAEEARMTESVDFLVGTFGKAAASMGAFVVCSRKVRDYLVNKARPFIFTTAMPPINLKWTIFVVEQLPSLGQKRAHLAYIAQEVRNALCEVGRQCPSTSHIIPVMAGSSPRALHEAETMQRRGFYALPVRPPTVPEGTSRIRLSLTADMAEKEAEELIECIRTL